MVVKSWISEPIDGTKPVPIPEVGITVQSDHFGKGITVSRRYPFRHATKLFPPDSRYTQVLFDSGESVTFQTSRFWEYCEVAK